MKKSQPTIYIISKIRVIGRDFLVNSEFSQFGIDTTENLLDYFDKVYFPNIKFGFDFNSKLGIILVLSQVYLLEIILYKNNY